MHNNTQQKHKIALILPTLHPGGMERVMSELANYFVLFEEVEVHFILFKKKANIFYQLDKQINIYVQEDGFFKKLKFFEFFTTLFFIRRTVRQIKPDVLMSFGTQWNNLVLLSMLGTSIPVFVSDRGSPARRYQTVQEWLRTLLYPKAAGIIAQTATAQKYSAGRFKHPNIKIIGNPIKRVKGQAERQNVILTVGRLIESKHHDRLIKIFAELTAPDWKLVIVGGEALKQNNMERLTKLVNELCLQGRVELLGSRIDVDDFYMSSRIFAFTSSVEGFPNVVGEAMSAGLPVVSYNCIAGPSEMIEDGKNGFLVPQFDDKLFGQRLQQLVDNEGLVREMSAASIATMERFSLERIGKKYLEFLLPKLVFENQKMGV